LRRSARRLRGGTGTPGGFPTPSSAKLQPFRARKDAALRARLTARLVEERPRLVLLVGPPGFGKTTLLAQWAALDPRPFAWLLADDEDNDPAVMWTYIAAAIAKSADDHLDEERLQAIGGDPDPGATLANELEQSGHEIVIAIDDYFQIESERCHDSLVRFIERAPPNVEIAIISRMAPPLPLARLRASGEVLELGVADLRFTLEESERFLNETLRMDLEPSVARALHDRTEGWPAGIYLAHFGLRSARDKATRDAPAATASATAVGTRFVQGFGASNRYVADYLNEEVLARLDEESLGFMLRTSVVRYVSAGLADALTERHDSAGRLIDLERANVFIEPLDDNREWYRYHVLLRELLLRELRRRWPDEEPRLHARASAWFEREGDAERAVGHAISAGDTERAARLIGESYVARIEWGRAATVEGWLRRLGDDVVEADGRLGVAKAWTLHFLGRHDEAARALAAARRAEPEGVLPDGTSSIEVAATMMDAAFPEGDVSRMLEAARKAFLHESERPTEWRIAAHVLLGLALVRAGRFAEAEPYLAKGEDLARQARRRMDEIGARALRARVALELGRPDRALKRARAAVNVARLSAMEATHSNALATAVLGDTLVSVGRPAEAETTLVQHLDYVRALYEPFVLAEFLLALARARQALGRTALAARTFDEVEEIIQAMPDAGDLRRSLREARRRKGPRPGEDLTAREIEVLRLLAAGLTSREAADRLFVSFNTVHSHVRTIYRKLGVGSRREAIARARQMGLTDAVEPT
jgi:LuxR family transcriptional regulator, maltose regulon positive regulatory protein